MKNITGKKTLIGWSPYLSNYNYEDTRYLEVLTDKPRNVNPIEYVSGDIMYCPALCALYKNVYAIKLPYKIILTTDIYGKLTAETTPDMVKNNIKKIVNITKTDRGYNVQILCQNLFVSDKPYTILETLPPILHGCRNEITYLNGAFDCHAWQRPIQFSFFVSDSIINSNMKNNSIVFDKGEVVMYVKFNTSNDSVTELHQLSPKDVDGISKHILRNMSINENIKGFNFIEIINRVRYRRPKKFLTELNYGKEKK